MACTLWNKLFYTWSLFVFCQGLFQDPQFYNHFFTGFFNKLEKYYSFNLHCYFTLVFLPFPFVSSWRRQLEVHCHLLSMALMGKAPFQEVRRSSLLYLFLDTLLSLRKASFICPRSYPQNFWAYQIILFQGSPAPCWITFCACLSLLDGQRASHKEASTGVWVPCCFHTTCSEVEEPRHTLTVMTIQYGKVTEDRE